MTGKTRLLALAAANLLLLASLMSGLYLFPRGGSRGGENVPLSRMISPAGLEGITVRDAGETVLRREGGGWSVMLGGKPFPADAGKIERFLQVAGGSRLGRTVTENRDLWEKFGVEDGASRRIVFSFPGGGTELILGRDEEGGGGQYVRIPGTGAVRLLSRSLSFYAEQKTPYWCFLRLFPGNLEGRDVTAVSVEKGPALSIFREKAGGGILWRKTGGGAAGNGKAADALADLLSRLAGTEFAVAPEEAAAGLENPSLRITFTTSGRKTYAAAFGGSAGENLLFCAGYSDGKPLPHVYKIGNFTLDRIGKLLREIAEGS